MSNLTIDRIMSQIDIQVREPVAPILEPKTTFLPISLLDLKKLLEDNLFNGTSRKILPEIKELSLNNIYDFALWYESNKQIFSDAQRVALDTLMIFRARIDEGCNCKRASRETRAHQYFEEFWTQNSGSDILPTVARVLSLNKVTIGNYCKYTQ